MTWLWPSLLGLSCIVQLTRSCGGIEQDFGPIGAGSLAVGQGSGRSLGCRVTANQSSCRRRWPTTRNANRHSNVSVGPTQRSISAIASAWLRRNVRQVCDGGPRRRIMYLETVDLAIWTPSLKQFTMDARSAPQWVLLAHPLDQFAQLTADSGPPPFDLQHRGADGGFRHAHRQRSPQPPHRSTAGR
jgi:hypothetical protein